MRIEVYLIVLGLGIYSLINRIIKYRNQDNLYGKIYFKGWGKGLLLALAPVLFLMLLADTYFDARAYLDRSQDLPVVVFLQLGLTFLIGIIYLLSEFLSLQDITFCQNGVWVNQYQNRSRFLAYDDVMAVEIIKERKRMLLQYYNKGLIQYGEVRYREEDLVDIIKFMDERVDSFTYEEGIC